MSSPSDQPDPPLRPSAQHLPGEPPATTFLLQLFLIPLLIVVMVVAVWLLFSWLANMGNDPHDLVRDLQRLDKGSWRQAYALTNQLRDPEHGSLKKDSALCRDLAAVLDAENKATQVSAERTRLRIFLCRALGEFHVPDGLDPLVEAASREHNDADVEVRRTALEALSVLSSQLGSQAILDHQRALSVMLAASRAAEGEDRTSQRAMLRSTAAFALGVVGGPVALDRLAEMLDDAYPNARYNAAIGLARHGRLESVPILLEMLDPDNARTLEGEDSESGRQFKQSLVLANAIRAATELAEAVDSPSATQLRPLRSAISQLVEDATVPRRIRLNAEAAISKWPRERAAGEL